MTIDHKAALKFLYGRIDYERTPTIPYQEKHLKLQRMERLLKLLGNPHRELAAIHIAGTKGKGSTATMIDAILTTSGLRTGLYSSPHLNRLEERIRINSQPCTSDQLVSLVNRVAPSVQQMDDEAVACATLRPNPNDFGDYGKPTYFEIMTAMAMLHFQSEGVDFAILEVGLGGRLDSTNVCHPIMTVITSISLDHTKQLGNTLAQIATEKAGIIKPGVPLISGVRDGEARDAIEQIARSKVPKVACATLGTDFDLDYGGNNTVGCRFDYRSIEVTPNAPNGRHLGDSKALADKSKRERPLPGELMCDVSVGMFGAHQAANASVAIRTVRQLAVSRNVEISETAIRTGLATARCPARIELLSNRPPTIVDAGHNRASIAALMSVLDESFGSCERILVFGTTSGKDVIGMLDQLVAACSDLILTQYRDNPRSYPTDKLAEQATSAVARAIATQSSAGDGPSGSTLAPLQLPTIHVEPDLKRAWRTARKLAGDDKLICVTGSFFLAAELRPTMLEEIDP